MRIIINNQLVWPSNSSLAFPSVIVEWMAPDVNHCIQSAWTAPNASTGPIKYPAIQIQLWNCVIEPKIYVDLNRKNNIYQLYLEPRKLYIKAA